MSRGKVLLLAFLVLTLFLPNFSLAEVVPLGTNLSPIASWNTARPFVNELKMAQPFREYNDGRDVGFAVLHLNGVETLGPRSSTTRGPTIFNVDEGGYPIDGLPKGKSVVGTYFMNATAFLYGTSSDPQGDYTVLFDGIGTLSFTGDVINKTQVNSNKYTITLKNNEPCSGASCRLQTVIKISSSSTSPNHVRNIRIIRNELVDSYDENQPFNQNYLDRLRNFSVLRFMDWKVTNANNETTWNTRRTPEWYTQGSSSTVAYIGVAPEYIYKMANIANKDVWINIPHAATDDYVQGLASMLHQNLDPGKKIYLEYSNEIWNVFGWPIGANGAYVKDKGVAMGLAANTTLARHYYQAMRSTEIFKLFDDEFGSDTSFEVINVVGAQSVTDNAQKVLEGTNTNKLAENGAKINPYYPNHQAEALAIAPYFGDPYTGTSSLETNISLLRTHLDTTTLGRIQDKKEVADSFGVDFLAYEGGQHLTQKDSSAGNGVIDAQRDSRMRTMYRDYFEQWYDEGGGLFMNFTFTMPPSGSSPFGILEYDTQSNSDAPKFAGVQDAIGDLVAAGYTLPPDPNTTSLCGNGDDTDPGETCDDGNRNSGDGCSFSCQTEFCGDGIINNTNEVCDGGSLGGQNCVTQGFDDGDLACNSGCSGYVTSDCTTVTPEICDNGQDDDGDGQTDCNDSECTSNPICIIPTKTITISDHFTQDVSSNTNINGSSVRNTIWDQATNYSPVATGSGGAEISVNSSSLEAVYRFNGNANDATGNFNGSCTACPTYTSDRFGTSNSAVQFNGTQSIEISNGPLAQSQPNGVSGATWVKADVAADSYVWEKKWNNFDLRYRSSNEYRCGIFGSGGSYQTLDSTTNIATGGWHHVACTFDPSDSKLRIYIDGVLDGSKTVSFGSNMFDRDTLDTYVGSRPNDSRYFTGAVDELGFWSRTLNDAEIQQLATGASLDAGFESDNIYNGEVLGVSASWIESNSGVSLDVSTDNGANWCSVSNGGTLNNSSCELGTGVEQKYRVNFFAETDLDQVTISLEVPDDSSTPECGNNVIEGTEVCDGTALANQTCSDHGFDAGTLNCAADCQSYDVSECFMAEVCDNSLDDDEDGFTDCDDLECSEHSACVTPSVCEITSVNWSDTKANHGDNVEVSVDTLNCTGNQLIIEIWEEDSGVDELTRFGFEDQIDSDNYITNWDVVFDTIYETGGNIEYYLLAKTGGSEERSGVLNVRRPASETGKGKKPPKKTSNDDPPISNTTSTTSNTIGSGGFEATTSDLVITELEQGKATSATIKVQHGFPQSSAFKLTMQVFKEGKLVFETDKSTALLTDSDDIHDLKFDETWKPKGSGEYEAIITLANPEETLTYDVQTYSYTVAAAGTVPPQELIGDDTVIIDAPEQAEDPMVDEPQTDEENPVLLIGLVVFGLIVVILVGVFIKKPFSGNGMINQAPPEEEIVDEEQFTLEPLEER